MTKATSKKVNNEAKNNRRNVDSTAPILASEVATKTKSNETKCEIGFFQKLQHLSSAILMCIHFILGVGALLYLSGFFAWAVMESHEAHLWFSNINDVEREISFRTESGLFYSYYKQLVNSSSFFQGVYDLTVDNVTEHPSTINLIRRMNIFPEILLAFIYKFSFFSTWYAPIVFYCKVVFTCSGCIVAAIFILAWLLANVKNSSVTGWPAGALAAVLYVRHREHVTRVEFSVGLREHFGLPFVWWQLIFLTLIFRPTLHQKFRKIVLVAFFFSCMGVALSWQFNQFIFLLQCFSVYAVTKTGIVLVSNATYVYVCILAAICSTYIMQLGNDMLITSPCFSFLIAALFTDRYTYIPKKLKLDSFIGRLLTLVFSIFQTLLVFVTINFVLKCIFAHNADSHIFQYVLTKLGIATMDDFVVRLYLCVGAFDWLPFSTFKELSQTGLFPIYAVCHTFLLCLTLAAMLKLLWKGSIGSTATATIQKSKQFTTDKTTAAAAVASTTSTLDNVLSNFDSFVTFFLKDRPDLAFHAVQALLFGILSITTLRMKYFWTPYMTVLASLALFEPVFWSSFWQMLLRSTSSFCSTLTWSWRHALVFGLLLSAWFPARQVIFEDHANLREFWDPDTVELMKWIMNSTKPSESFAGSMQLLAGVKCCTSRHITNHPHFEDATLRLKTRELYEMYARASFEKVHAMLLKYDANYIILEDSICLARSSGCRLSDLLDEDNGELPDWAASLDFKSNEPTAYLRIKEAIDAEDLSSTDMQLRQRTFERQVGVATNALRVPDPRTPRFCDEIRHSHSQEKHEAQRFFRLVLQNRTFRVYQVLKT